MTRIKYVLVFVVLIISVITNSQSLPHFKIGESTFANSDIYSIHKSKDNALYVATNDGLFLYQYNQFVSIPSIKSQKGNSFFSLKSNAKGEVFCNNLKGQFFKIVNNKLTLYYELVPEDLSNEIEYFFDSNDNLLIFSKYFIKLNSKLEKETILEVRKNKDLLVRPMKMIDGSIICSFCYDKENLYLTYKNSQLEIKKYEEIPYTNDGEVLQGSIAGFIFDEKLIYATEFNEFSNAFPVKTLNNSRRKVFQLSNKFLLSLDFKKGLNLWSLKDSILTQHKTLFPNTFISTHYYHTDGTLFLGTFGEGVIVVPSINSIEEDLASTLRGIDVNNGKTIIGSREGAIYEYTDSLIKIAERKINIDEVYALNYSYSFLPEEHIVSSYGSLASFPVIKDIKETNSGLFIATNDGIYYASDNIENLEFEPLVKEIRDKNSVLIHGRGERFSTLAYSIKTKELYFSDFNKIEYLREKSNPTELLLDNESIFCNDLSFYKNFLIVATPDKGVLFFSNHEINHVLNINSGLSSNNVKKIKVVNDLLYILTKENLQVLDLKQDKIITLGTEHGIIDNLISNFSADVDNLVILKSKSFIKVSTKMFKYKSKELLFSIDSIKSGKVLIDFKKYFSLDETQNKLFLFVKFDDIIRSRDAFFQVKVDNLDWVSYPANKNEIEILNYGSGEHNLSIRLKYGNEFYDYKKLKFKQLPPLHLRWWFYPLIILITATTIILFFRRKLRVQAKESRRVNELNSSKLRAIQSQMNPHFIFNALNSIQYLVLSGATESAYNYITRFANLVRRTLDYSDKEHISIYEEIELLEVYLEIEKLRFQDDFDYEVIKTSIREVMVPPMLIQPFIENALVHGLLHKEGFKKLTLSIEVLDNYILCKVEDNGIGRDEAKKIRSRQRGDHKSFAINAINNRFRILNESYKEKLGYEYEDLTPGENGVVTRVILRIPIK